MSDPRCNCGDSDCPICTAPVHRPWQPKAGQPTPEPVGEPDPLRLAMLQRIYQLQDKLRETRWTMLRRYALVLLMTGLGSMIGSAITLHFLN